MNLAGAPPPLDHLLALSDAVGILQHADGDVPNRNEGYCTDDAARAFIVAVRASDHASCRVGELRLARKAGVHENTIHFWKKKYGQLGTSEIREMNELRDENTRLKRLVADLALDKSHALATP